MGQVKHLMERIEELEAALDKALQNWENCCVRFKGSYLTKLDRDDVIIDNLRKILRGN